jgi:hypothetical protein
MKLPPGFSRFVGAALLIILGTPVWMTFTWLQYRKFVIRDEIENRLEKGIEQEDLLLLKFARKEALKEIRWEHGGEFEYGRQMYDVVETWELGDTLFFRCLQDREETRLKSELAGLVSGALRNDPRRNEKQEQLLTFFKSLYFLDLSPWNPETPELMIAWPRPDQRVESISIPPPKPPPRKS